ncbi:hypothetical protein AUP74_01969 [Microbulbifer aggregans]|uniref:Transglycosylase SLT domain-containing protein n=1 Tax=Microbulbifer aggregans TaxID=1769779 RepID=A0A1C9W8B2_9GAMM|nr:hypothetical protein [Microbulbifer aggregans]AOS97399.1 hypothetical protein AUP74_01969 [Microbulbifer aggregans]
MGICLDELRLLVIRPTLKHLRAWSAGMENLLLGTAAQESQLGFHLKQGRRHGLGIYQIQPHTHREIWDDYLIGHPALASKVRGLASQRDFLDHPHSELTTNLRYATAIAWLIYRAADADKVAEDDVPTMARLWHQHFHHGPAASQRDFEQSYAQLVSGADPTDSAPRYTGEPPPLRRHPAPRSSPGALLPDRHAQQPLA